MTPAEAFDMNLILQIGAGIMVLCLILSVLDWLHSKLTVCCCCRCCGASDEFKWSIVMVIGLRVCNLLFDISLLYWMCLWYLHHEADLQILILIAVSLSSLLITYIANLFSIHKLSKLECECSGPREWFAKYKCVFVLFVMLTSDSYLCLQLISSNLYGADLFNSGHSLLDFRRARDIKTATILIQNLPQMLVQIAFAVLILLEFNNLIIAAITTTVLLSIPIVFSWLFGAVVYRKIFTWKEYDLEFLLVACNPSSITEENNKLIQSQSIIKYKGYKKALRKKICSIIGISTSILRVAYIEMNENDDGATIHILHRVAKPDRKRERDSKSDLAQLYEGKYQLISDEIHKLYHIHPEWTFVCCMLAPQQDHHDRDHEQPFDHVDDGEHRAEPREFNHRQSSLAALRLSQHQKAVNQPETQLTQIILDADNHDYHEEKKKQQEHRNEDADKEEEEEPKEQLERNKLKKNNHSGHEYVPSETVTPFELVTSGSEMDDELVNRRLDEKRKGMDIKPINAVSKHSVHALNSPNLSNRTGSARAASLNIIHEPHQQMNRTPSVVAVTPMNEQGIILNADNEEPSSSSSMDDDANDYKMQLPSHVNSSRSYQPQQQHVHNLQQQHKQQSFPEQYLSSQPAPNAHAMQQQSYSNANANTYGLRQPQQQGMVRSAPPDMHMSREQMNAFQKHASSNSESIADEEIPDVPQSASRASDVFGVGSDDVFSSPVVVTPMQLIQQEEHEALDEEEYED